MKLTRRDAMIALGGLGLFGVARVSEDRTTASELTDDDIHDLVAIAQVLYPSAADVESSFVETYIGGQRKLDASYPDQVRNALETIRERSRLRTGKPISALTEEQLDTVLRATGADRAYPDPEGTAAARVRFYIINNLLYALYTTPKGGDLIGNPNPPGYPGGTEAYQEVTPDE